MHARDRVCRDRAEERRRGVNPDYESANKLAAALPGDVDVSKLSVEETKFLGGDIDHTHLVKGLDFALLQKVHMGGAQGACTCVRPTCGSPSLHACVVLTPCAPSVPPCPLTGAQQARRERQGGHLQGRRCGSRSSRPRRQDEQGRTDGRRCCRCRQRRHCQG